MPSIYNHWLVALSLAVAMLVSYTALRLASRVATSEGKGTSYKKMLCAAFDMAVLETYADKSFYRFVYHDGILLSQIVLLSQQELEVTVVRAGSQGGIEDLALVVGVAAEVGG